jgi:hypothetical protein
LDGIFGFENMIEDSLEDEWIIELEAIDWVLDFVGFLFG